MTLAGRVAAIDLGASSGRVVGVSFASGTAVIDVTHRFPNAPVRIEDAAGGRWSWDLTALLAGIEAGLSVVAAAGPVDSIAVDSWGVDYGLLDETGRLVAPITAYRDTRHHACHERWRRTLGDEAIYGRTGIQFLPFNTLYQLAADAEDPTRPLERATRMLMIPDLVAHRLCGSLVAERTNAGTTQCYDSAADEWATDLLDAVGVPTGILPEVIAGESHPPLGTLDPALAARVGLSDGTPVRATASHDTAAAVAACPLAGPEDVFVSSGTWSLVGLELDAPVRTEHARLANVTNEPGVFGTTRLLRNVCGLWLVQECRRAWAAAGRDRDWTTLAAMAEAEPPFRTVIDPDHPDLATPGDMPARIVARARATGQPIPETDAAIVRTALDSIALRTAEVALRCAGLAGRDPSRIVVVGGGAANALLDRLVAACAGLPVHVGPTEATALGNAVVQQAATRGLTSTAALRDLLPAATPAADPDDLPVVRARAAEARERLD